MPNIVLTHLGLFLGNNHTRSGATLEILRIVATILQMHTGKRVLLVHIQVLVKAVTVIDLDMDMYIRM